jgi:two-component system, OmpR family, sensor histidine kinase QseC
MNSLRVRLLAIIGAALVVLWSAVAAWMLHDVRGEVHGALDERLAASARLVAGLAAQFAPGDASLTRLPGSLMDVVARDGLACEVSLVRGELSVRKVARTGASPPMEDAAPGYGTRIYGGKLWRTYVLQQGDIRVATADRLDLRDELLRDVALAAGVPFGVALLGTMVTLWFGIGGGLAPLERMRKLLAARRPGDDAPLPPMAVPQELRPLVATIVALLQRMRSTLERERRFTDDAAHELRTPLTAVKTHLQVLRLALREQARDPAVSPALADAQEAVQRMQHTLEQLLLLARLEAGDDPQEARACEPAAAASRAARDAQAARHEAERVVLQVDTGVGPVRISEALLVTALRNLLDNALRIAPAGSPVLLQVAQEAGVVSISVLDEGPGLTPAQCALAPRRFWRASPVGTGSGLGLAITASIVGRHGGALALAPRSPHGLRATITVPAATDPR